MSTSIDADELLRLRQLACDVSNRLLRSRAKASDCGARAIEQLLAAIAAGVQIEDPDGWVIWTSRCRAIDLIRKEVRAKAALRRHAGEIVEALGGMAADTSTIVEQQMYAAEVMSVINNMREPRRTVMRMIAAEYSIEEIAAHIGTTSGTVKAHVYQGRKSLRRRGFEPLAVFVNWLARDKRRKLALAALGLTTLASLGLAPFIAGQHQDSLAHGPGRPTCHMCASLPLRLDAVHQAITSQPASGPTPHATVSAKRRSTPLTKTRVATVGTKHKVVSVDYYSGGSIPDDPVALVQYCAKRLSLDPQHLGCPPDGVSVSQ